MKLTFISDTHSLHEQLPNLGQGDVLIHCGDLTGQGTLSDTENFVSYFAAQDYAHKVVVAGNHDTCFEDDRRLQAENCLSSAGVIYLNDESIELDGIQFWGSPIQPEFFNWSFQRQRGSEIREHWDLIPRNIDVLITHGPPFGILDLCHNGGHAGCEELLEVVNQIKPRIHAFGHIHEAYGVQQQNGTTFVNACNLDGRFRMNQAPITLKI